MANEIQHASLAVQIDGKPYFIHLEHDRMMLLLQMASTRRECRDAIEFVYKEAAA